MPALGAGGREFDPLHSDQFYSRVAQRQSRGLLIRWSLVRSQPLEPIKGGEQHW